jgi:uncharacterized protein (UPF0332 family)
MDEKLLDLSKYRLIKAHDDLAAAELMYKNGQFAQSMNRSYYAMFHAVRALLALYRFDSQKHSGVIAYFNQHFVKNKVIEHEYAVMLSKAFKIRIESDYEDFFIAARDDAKLQLENAQALIKRIEKQISIDGK